MQDTIDDILLPLFLNTMLETHHTLFSSKEEREASEKDLKSDITNDL